MRRCRRGFTFPELLAAMVFMAIVVPVAVQGVTLSARMATVADRGRMAMQLADDLLAELVLTGDWRSSDEDGDFGEDRPNYRWELEDEAWEEDTLRVLTLTVFYEVQGREQSVHLSALVEETEE